MPTIDAALVAALNAEATVSATLGNRIFPVGGRQGQAYPYATYQRISTQTAAHLDGPSDLDWPRFQIDIWGQSVPSLWAAADAIRAFLEAATHTAAGLTFTATFQDQRGPEIDEETRNWRVSQDYLLWHERN